MTQIKDQSASPAFERGDFRTAAIDDPTIRAFVETYQRDGTAVLDLGAEARVLCDQAVREMAPFFKRNNRGRVLDGWRRSPAVRALASLPAIREMLRAAYGRDAFPFQTINFDRGTEQRIHLDEIHFDSVPPRFMCGVWIALEDIQPNAGPLAYYPGSHCLPPIRMRDAGITGRASKKASQRFTDHLMERLAESNLSRKEAVIPKGHAFFWAANLAHGGSPIADPETTRRSVVVHFYFEDCLYFTPMSSDEPRGKLFVRMPYDINRKRYVWPKRDGSWALPSPLSVLPQMFWNTFRIALPRR